MGELRDGPEYSEIEAIAPSYSTIFVLKHAALLFISLFQKFLIHQNSLCTCINLIYSFKIFFLMNPLKELPAITLYKM